MENPDARTIYRHRLPTRLWHWTNALALLILLMSGLMIFNAHPRLYWGKYGANFDTPWLQIGSTATGGHVVVGPVEVPTGGVLGRWKDKQGIERTRAFPWWATLPSDYSLAAARRWHFLFACVLVLSGLGFVIASLVNRHLQRDLAPTRKDLRPAHIWEDIKDHFRLKFHDADDPGRYNTLQKFSYLGVIFGLIPLMVLTGLTMSPGFNSTLPWLLDLFGGRQSARSIHFLCAFGLLGFFFVHIVMVVLAGPVNEVRSIVTGWYRPPAERSHD